MRVPLYLLCCGSLYLLSASVKAEGCNLLSDGTCLCTEELCDTLPSVGTLQPGEIAVYTSSKSGKRFERTTGTFSTMNPKNSFNIAVDPSSKERSLFGVGGAFTDAAAINFHSVSPGLQQHILNSYWGEGGIGFSIGRIPMGSCDFSTYMYSNDDSPMDLELKNFSIAVDFQTGKIPFIQQALKMRPIRLFASPWSPPKWMKSNGQREGGTMKGVPGDAIHKSWALYFVKFIQAYAAEAGLDIWGVTTQNEPNTALKYGWDSCQWSAEQQRDWLKMDLGPAMRSGVPQVKIMVLDGQRTYLPSYAATILNDAQAAQYVDGVGMHWYGSVHDTISVASKVNDTFTEFPGVFGLATEACNGFIPILDQGPKPGDWSRGEYYSHDMLVDFNNGASGWTDWNLVLDMQGGPNHAKNFVDAPILVNATGGYALKNPMFYHLGHFSAFMPNGSVKVGCRSTSSNLVLPPIESMAWTSADGTMVYTLLLNRDSLMGRDYTLQLGGKFYSGNIEKSSIVTLVTSAL